MTTETTVPAPTSPDRSEDEAAREVELFEAWLRDGYTDRTRAKVVLRAVALWRPQITARVRQIMAEIPEGEDPIAPLTTKVTAVTIPS